MMNRLLMVLLLVGLIAGQAGTGATAYFTDAESNAGNTFEAWVSSQWVQTTQGDFQAGVLDNVDTSSSPGDVKLEIVLQEPTTTIGLEEDSWSRRAPVTISNPGAGLTDYQVRVDVTYDADMQPDFDDIRFVDSDDSTELSHWRGSYNASTSAIFWVKVPSIPSGNKTIYMYYGNASASSASDGDATFEFFDDFEDGDISDWSQYGSGTVQIANDGGNYVLLKTAFNDPNGGYSVFNNGALSSFEAVFRTKRINENGGTQNRYGIEDGSFNGYGPRMYDFNTLPSNFAIEQRTGGVSTNLVVKSTSAYEWDTWMTVKFRRYGNILEFELYNSSGSLVESISTSDSSYNSFDRFVVHGGWEFYTDDIRVRKYASPEPTTSIGLEENSWSRRAPVTISNPGSGLTDYQVRVDVNYDADMQPDFDDIRFKDSDDSTELSHWRESYTASTSAIFWVKVPSIPSGDKTNYMYYGNDAASSASNGTATFEFFDDFEDGDISDWSQYVNGIVQIANDGGNYVLLKTAYNDRNGGYSLFNNGALSKFEAVFRTKRINETGGRQTRYGIEDSSFNGYGPRMYDFNTLPSNFAIERRTGGLSTNLAIKSTSAYEWDTWMTVKFRRYGSTLEFELYDSSGSLVESISTSDALYNSFDRFVVHGGWEFYTDDIRVRKYAPQITYVSSGTIASQVLDTGVSGAKWDALFWDETLPANTDITFEVRASNTSFAKNATTPSWTFVGGTSPVTSGLPSGRYLQWRATLTTSDTSKTPTLQEVTVDYY
jgi:predicted ribosomally synthesized peptide with SipW-like signal peptide